MAKFKIGDSVKILDGSTIPEYTCGWSYDMKKYIGKTCKIVNFVDFGDRTGVRLDGMPCTWDERGLELTREFKVGDLIIGNDKAHVYAVTHEGWVGKVVGVKECEICVEGKNRRGEMSEYWVNPSCFDLYNSASKSFVDFGKRTVKERIEEMLNLSQSPIITEEEAMTTFSFKIEEGFRIDKTCNKQIPTITTTVNYLNMTPWGSATCDKSDYDEREGILNAIANAVYDGNFDRVYSKYKAKLKRDYEDSCKCKNCGKSFKTPKEARACEKAHIDRKKAKHENYLIRKEAKRKIAEAEREGKINQVMRELATKKGR